MAILIIGLDSPKNCWTCEFRNIGYCVADKERRFIGVGAKIEEMGGKMPWCPVREATELTATLKEETK